MMAYRLRPGLYRPASMVDRPRKARAYAPFCRLASTCSTCCLDICACLVLCDEPFLLVLLPPPRPAEGFSGVLNIGPFVNRKSR